MSRDDRHFDVVVVGGGVTGTAAAIAAARAGAEVLLVERNACLGGWQTAGLVSHFSALLGPDGKQMVFGIPGEVIDRLVEEDGSVGILYRSKGMVHFDPEVLKRIFDEMVLEAGVQPLYYTEFYKTIVEDGVVRGVELFTRGGIESVSASVVIDTSSDAVVAISAGAQHERVPPSKYMGATLMFLVSGADTPRVAQYVEDHPEEFNKESRFWRYINDFPGKNGPRTVVGGCGFSESIAKAQANGDLPTEDRPNFVAFMTGGTRPGVFDFNAIFLSGVDWTDSWDLTRATIEGRQRAKRLVEFLQNYIPGFEDAHLAETGPLAIRESRRVVGDYMLTGEDVLQSKVFPDAVVRAFFPLDIAGGDEHKLEEADEPYTIPYRSFLPKGLENLLVAGKGISATQDALGSARISPISMLGGQAVGTAAALAIKAGVAPRQIDVQQLQESLKQQGALELPQ